MTETTANPAAPSSDLPRCDSMRPTETEMVLCRDLVTALVETGCVHEHITRKWVCAEHADMVLGGEMNCGPCWVGAERHQCTLAGRVVETRG